MYIYYNVCCTVCIILLSLIFLSLVFDVVFFGVSEGGVVVERWRNQKKVGFVVNRGVATSETG